ncbi:hypothetical protein PYCC9005_006016 [Savitreella phatthalungensis]
MSSPTDASDGGTTFGASLSIEIADKGIDAMSISPSGRDVALASRKGLLIVDLDNPYEPPRFLPYLTAWNVADVQWNVHRHRTNWICSTSNQKLFIWNLDMPSRKAVEFVLGGHARAITDINWSAHQPEILASCSVDAFVHCWDMRDSRRPVNAFSDWQAGATQVKWNRQNEHIIASSHGRYLRIWDDRKGASPLTSIEVASQPTKVYGIDFNRTRESGIISCALDKSVKFWDYSKSLTEPEQTIRTTTPVWRARHTPMGWGLLTLPQRGDNNLYLWDRRGEGDNPEPPVHVFSGHTDQVKEYLWRARGGQDPTVDDREFQLVTWSKDQTLRLWPVNQDVLGRIGHDPKQPIRIRQTRRGAPYVTYRRELEHTKHSHTQTSEPSRSLAASLSSLGEDRLTNSQLLTGPTHTTVKPGESQTGYSAIQWMRGVRMTRENNSSGDASKFDKDAAATGAEAMILGEEFPQIETKFPKVKFEEASVRQRSCTLSLQGPWGEQTTTGEPELTFLRLKVAFPKGYPSLATPKFDLEKTKALGDETRLRLLKELSAIAVRYRERAKPCLEAFVRHLLGEDVLQEHLEDGRASSSDSESDDDSTNMRDYDLLDGAQQNVPLPRSSAALWCGNKLVCFFSTKMFEHDTSAAVSRRESAIPPTSAMKKRRAQRFFASFGYLSHPGDNDEVDLMGAGGPGTGGDSDNELDDFDVQDVIAARHAAMTSNSAAAANLSRKLGSGSVQDRASTARIAQSYASEALTKDVVVIRDMSEIVGLRETFAHDWQIGSDAALCAKNARIAYANNNIEIAQAWEMASLLLEPLPSVDHAGDLPLVYDVEPAAVFGKRKGFRGDLLRHFQGKADLQMFAMLSCAFGLQDEKCHEKEQPNCSSKRDSILSPNTALPAVSEQLGRNESGGRFSLRSLVSLEESPFVDQSPGSQERQPHPHLGRADSQASITSIPAGALSSWLSRRSSSKAGTPSQPPAPAPVQQQAQSAGSASGPGSGSNSAQARSLRTAPNSVSKSLASQDSSGLAWPQLPMVEIFTDVVPDLHIEHIPLHSSDEHFADELDLQLELAEQDARDAYADHLYRFNEQVRAVEMRSYNHRQRRLGDVLVPAGDFLAAQAVAMQYSHIHGNDIQSRTSSTSTAKPTDRSAADAGRQQSFSTTHSGGITPSQSSAALNLLSSSLPGTRRATMGAATMSRGQAQELLREAARSPQDQLVTAPYVASSLAPAAAARLHHHRRESGPTAAIAAPLGQQQPVRPPAGLSHMLPMHRALTRARAQEHEGPEIRVRCSDCKGFAAQPCPGGRCHGAPTQFECAVCQITVKGRAEVCPVCEHGGHMRCMLQWRAQASQIANKPRHRPHRPHEPDPQLASARASSTPIASETPRTRGTAAELHNNLIAQEIATILKMQQQRSRSRSRTRTTQPAEYNRHDHDDDDEDDEEEGVLSHHTHHQPVIASPSPEALAYLACPTGCGCLCGLSDRVVDVSAVLLGESAAPLPTQQDHRPLQRQHLLPSASFSPHNPTTTTHPPRRQSSILSDTSSHTLTPTHHITRVSPRRTERRLHTANPASTDVVASVGEGRKFPGSISPSDGSWGVGGGGGVAPKMRDLWRRTTTTSSPTT